MKRGREGGRKDDMKGWREERRYEGREGGRKEGRKTKQEEIAETITSSDRNDCFICVSDRNLEKKNLQ